MKMLSWTDTLNTARMTERSIVLLVEQKNCAYCQRLKRDLFVPLARDPEYQEQLVFVSLRTDPDEPLVEKNGKEISTFEFAQSFDALTTPTILFLDSDGNEISHRLVGYTADAEYSQQLLSRLQISSTAVR